jgi:hypothetical protein
MNGDGLAREVRRLVTRVSHWTPPRWAASSATEPADGAAPGSRADAVYALVQELADLAAVAEGEPRRVVPRLSHDGALVDQLRVVSADLLAVGAPAELEAAAQMVARTRRSL